jgi:hypothetical protein
LRNFGAYPIHYRIMTLHRRFIAILLLALAFLIPAPSFADSAEAVMNDTLVQMDRVADTILTIKDKATAEKAMADLQTIVVELKKIAARAKAVGQPPAELKEKLMTQFRTKTAEVQKRIAGAKDQIAKAGLEAAAVLGKGMVEFGKGMQEVGEAFQAADK